MKTLLLAAVALLAPVTATAMTAAEYYVKDRSAQCTALATTQESYARCFRTGVMAFMRATGTDSTNVALVTVELANLIDYAREKDQRTIPPDVYMSLARAGTGYVKKHLEPPPAPPQYVYVPERQQTTQTECFRTGSGGMSCWSR